MVHCPQSLRGAQLHQNGTAGTSAADGREEFAIAVKVSFLVRGVDDVFSVWDLGFVVSSFVLSVVRVESWCAWS